MNNVPEYHQTEHAKNILDRVANNPESFSYEEIVKIFSAWNCVVRLRNLHMEIIS